MVRFTSTNQQSDLRQHSTLIGIVDLTFSNQPSHFLPQPPSTMSSSVSVSSFDLQPQNPMPLSGHDHPLSSTHDHTDKHCLPQPTDLWHHSNPAGTSNPHIALSVDLSVLHKISISLFFRHHVSHPYSIAGLT